MLIVLKPLIGRSIFIDILPRLPHNLRILGNRICFDKSYRGHTDPEIRVIDHANLTFANKKHFIGKDNELFFIV